jgi:hypothetical protein
MNLESEIMVLKIAFGGYINLAVRLKDNNFSGVSIDSKSFALELVSVACRLFWILLAYYWN